MTSKPRFTISLDNRLNKKVEKFQEDNDFATKSGAIQELIRVGLAALQEEERKEEERK